MIHSDRMTRRGFRPVAFFLATTALILAQPCWAGQSQSHWMTIANGAFPLGAAAVAAPSPTGALIQFRGGTMGTTYSVKVSRPPERADWQSEATLAVDAELRRVNDQMSTYLRSSELSRFNDSGSTDWFDVSVETASVVQFALDVGQRSGGAFDVTVGPLVDRWSFGPGERNRDVPSAEELEAIGRQIGQSHLSVRLDPPALKKDIPQLRVDLSAIAKGHGVDRVVDVLSRLGAQNVFVEIGGEVRVTGEKQTPDGPQPWRVGIQKPDAMNNEIVAAYRIEDAAMATSGDYRNFFEFEGERYSHTIDPVTLRPVRHNLASVTVVASSCMAADAWATALDVAGPQRAAQLASENDLDTLLITRRDNGPTTDGTLDESLENQMNYMGTGTLAAIADRMQNSGTLAQNAAADGAGFFERMGPIALLTGIGFAVVLAAMAVGVIFGRRAISGSCGGLNARTDEDGVSRCSMCSSPSEGCEKLREKIENQ
ncbi:FAD:protein FMN transferase [Allorhodopirellula solitaria]|nr:FAD:protein FMN transferase [Allorhodopirellula solitaria]